MRARGVTPLKLCRVDAAREWVVDSYLLTGF